MIRLLDHEKDMPVLEEAWNWRNSAPQWFRDSLDIFKESWEEFLVAVPDELHYGIFVDEKPTAVVRLIEAYPAVYNIHLSAKRKTDFNIILDYGLRLRNFLFENEVKGMYGWIVKENRGVCHLYEQLGFTDTGIRCYKGMIGNRLGEFRHYAIINPLINKG